MAEMILKSKLRQKGINDIEVSSAGEYAEEGSKMNKNSVYALTQMGYEINEEFRSKRASIELKNRYDLLIYMEKFDKWLNRLIEKVKCMDDFSKMGDIADPYGSDENEYLRTCEQIEFACEKIIEKLEKGELF